MAVECGVNAITASTSSKRSPNVRHSQRGVTDEVGLMARREGKGDADVGRRD
jgi:hypothetical protein